MTDIAKSSTLRFNIQHEYNKSKEKPRNKSWFDICNYLFVNELSFIYGTLQGICSLRVAYTTSPIDA